MNRYGELIHPDTLQFERLLPGPIERVWEYLVDDEKRGKWFASGPMDMHKGGNMKLIFDHSKLSPEPDPIPEKYREYENGAESSATVIKFEPPRLLVIDWDGIVTFELEEIGSEVKLTLTHEKLKEDRDFRLGVFGGWHTHLDILVDHLNGRTPKGFWKVHTKLEEEYDKMLRVK